MIQDVLLTAFHARAALGIKEVGQILRKAYNKLYRSGLNFQHIASYSSTLIEVVQSDPDLRSELLNDKDQFKVSACIAVSEVEDLYLKLNTKDDEKTIAAIFKKISVIYYRYKDKFHFDFIEHKLALVQCLLGQSKSIDDPQRIKRLTDKYLAEALLKGNCNSMIKLAEIRFMQGEKNRPIFWLFLSLVVTWANSNRNWMMNIDEVIPAKFSDRLGPSYTLESDYDLKEIVRKFNKLKTKIEQERTTIKPLLKNPLKVLEILQNEKRIKKALSSEGIKLEEWISKKEPNISQSSFILMPAPSRISIQPQLLEEAIELRPIHKAER